MLYKTGEKAPSTGDYEFVMHLDGTMKCTSEERRIRLEKGEAFPPHKSCGKACLYPIQQENQFGAQSQSRAIFVRIMVS